jgi:hypothetical protein
MNFRFPNVPKELLAKLVLGWGWRRIGVGKLLRDRIIHVPEDATLDAARQADDLAMRLAQADPEQRGLQYHRWRAQELVQVAIVEGTVQGHDGS